MTGDGSQLVMLEAAKHNFRKQQCLLPEIMTHGCISLVSSHVLSVLYPLNPYLNCGCRSYVLQTELKPDCLVEMRLKGRNIY